MSKFLEASMIYTTDCSGSYVPQFESLQDLIKKCYKSPENKCVDGRTFCYALNSSLKKIIKENLKIGESYPLKAYSFFIFYSPLNSSTDKKSNIIEISEGIFKNCSSITGGEHFINIAESYGVINVQFEVCRGK